MQSATRPLDERERLAVALGGNSTGIGGGANSVVNWVIRGAFLSCLYWRELGEVVPMSAQFSKPVGVLFTSVPRAHNSEVQFLKSSVYCPGSDSCHMQPGR